MSLIPLFTLLPNLPFISNEIQVNLWLLSLILTICSYTIQVFTHRFAIRATGVREATYEQAIGVAITEFGLLWLLSSVARDLFLPWYAWLAVLLAVRIVTFRFSFKAEWGKAIVGATISTALWAVAYVAVAYVILWLTGYLRF
jgi:hypothetical protein